MYDVILTKLKKVELLLEELNMQQKEVLTFKEACKYLDLSASHLYKLTSGKSIPHFCPNGKKLYFNRKELESWIQQGRQITDAELETQASNYVMSSKANTYEG